MDLMTLLKAIPSTEPAGFNEFLRALGSDSPGEKSEWAAMFRLIEQAEQDDLVEVDRSGGKISALILTESGAAMVRGK